MPELVNTKRRRGRKPKYAKRAVMDFPEGFLDNSNTSLNILNAGRKRNIKTANISILNYVKTPHKKTKTQKFNNLVIILGDSFISVISNINNNNLLITKYSLQIFIAFSSIMAKTNH